MRIWRQLGSCFTVPGLYDVQYRCMRPTTPRKAQCDCICKLCGKEPGALLCHAEGELGDERAVRALTL